MTQALEKPGLAPGANKIAPLRRNANLLTARGVEGETPLGVVDVEKRTVTFTFSSETPVPMWYGTEILSHATGAVQLERINTGAPLLFNHDFNDLLGVIERAWIGADKRGYCTVRFGPDERGEWAMQQVIAQVLQNVSVTYRVHEELWDKDADVYTATSWTPFEISLCSCSGVY